MTTAVPGRRRCLFCGRPPVTHEHHPTGRRWDPDVVVPLCHSHHMLVHDDWHRAGVGPKVEPQTGLHALAMTSRRWGLLCGRLCREGVVCGLTQPLGLWFDAHADRLDAMAQALDQLGPGWRGLAVFVTPPDPGGPDC